jgi:uncharacterized membrane protein YraQ (UPF0718 family)
MSFWIASPSMDPEIFFLSSSMIGLRLAIWRLVSTFVISLAAGYITHFVYASGFIAAGDSLRNKKGIASGVIRTEDEPCSCSQSDWKRRILPETMKATAMVAKFMGIAFLVTALIEFYVPDDFIRVITGKNSNVQVLIAAMVGIPAYTSNLTALPFIGSLLQSGLTGGAALSFLIAGATTTLPALIAVWGIASRKVFLLYLLFILAGSVITGLLYNFVTRV